MANSLNKVQIIGNITRDIELKETKGGDPICTVDIATNRPVKNENGEWTQAPDYHSVVLWGKTAEIASMYLRKGDKVYFEGSLQTRSWEAEDGSKRYRTEIRAKEMIMLNSRRKDEEDSNREYARRSTAPAKKQQSLNEISDEMNTPPELKNIQLEDLPF